MRPFLCGNFIIGITALSPNRFLCDAGSGFYMLWLGNTFFDENCCGKFSVWGSGKNIQKNNSF